MKKLIVANWKMNPSAQTKAKKLLSALNKGLGKKNKAEVVVCPPFVYLETATKYNSFKLGAQDCSWHDKGAFTGEVSPEMLADLNVKYVIVGHSERRKIFEESNQDVNQKIKAVLRNKMTPILCVGETEEERGKSETFKVIEKELEEGLVDIPKNKVEKVVIAYEPIWAVGTGNACLPDVALTANLFIRKIISKNYSKKISQNIRVLYGGSVNAENYADYLNSSYSSGVLVGGVSLDAKEFLQIAV